MLVISRKERESFRVGDDVVVHVIQVRGGKVRVGIEAPRELAVVRTEHELDHEPTPAPTDPEKSAA